MIYKLHRKNISLSCFIQQSDFVYKLKNIIYQNIENNIFVNYLTFSLKINHDQEVKEAVVNWIFTLLMEQDYLESFTSQEFWTNKLNISTTWVSFHSY